MFSLNRITNCLHRRCYQYALAGFVALSLGYLMREQLNLTNESAVFLLGIFPNLSGSFATPFLLTFLLAQRFPSIKTLDHPGSFGLVNLFTFTVSCFIEYLHVWFGAGALDSNDIVASLAGGLAAVIVFLLTRRMTITG